MHILLITNGPLPDPGIYAADLRRADCVICADGGANRACAAGIKPAYVIGDFDSLAEETRHRLAETKFISRPSQQATDLEKALRFALDLGAENITLLGVSGGRLDHQMANLSTVQKYSRAAVIEIKDASGWGRFIRGTHTFRTQIGQHISLFAFRKASGIRTQGLMYPLQSQSLAWGERTGQSNEAVAETVVISVKRGTLFVFLVWPGLR